MKFEKYSELIACIENGQRIDYRLKGKFVWRPFNNTNPAVFSEFSKYEFRPTNFQIRCFANVTKSGVTLLFTTYEKAIEYANGREENFARIAVEMKEVD